MYRGQYDTDVTVWSPQGRLLQVEYAGEAVKQGSISLGLSNKRYVLLAALKVTSHIDGRSALLARSRGSRKRCMLLMSIAVWAFLVSILTLESYGKSHYTSHNHQSSFLRAEATKERDAYDRSISVAKLCSLLADSRDI